MARGQTIDFQGRFQETCARIPDQTKVLQDALKANELSLSNIPVLQLLAQPYLSARTATCHLTRLQQKTKNPILSAIFFQAAALQLKSVAPPTAVEAFFSLILSHTLSALVFFGVTPTIAMKIMHLLRTPPSRETLDEVMQYLHAWPPAGASIISTFGLARIQIVNGEHYQENDIALGWLYQAAQAWEQTNHEQGIPDRIAAVFNRTENRRMAVIGTGDDVVELTYQRQSLPCQLFQSCFVQIEIKREDREEDLLNEAYLKQFIFSGDFTKLNIFSIEDLVTHKTPQEIIAFAQALQDSFETIQEDGNRLWIALACYEKILQTHRLPARILSEGEK